MNRLSEISTVQPFDHSSNLSWQAGIGATRCRRTAISARRV
jgi:hypothetical protein